MRWGLMPDDKLRGSKKPEPPSASLIKQLWGEGKDEEISQLHARYKEQLAAWEQAQKNPDPFQEKVARVTGSLKEEGMPKAHSYVHRTGTKLSDTLARTVDLLGKLSDLKEAVNGVKTDIEEAKDLAAGIHSDADSDHAEKAAELLATGESDVDDVMNAINSAEDELEELKGKLESL